MSNTNQLTLPQKVLDDWNSLSSEQLACLRWNGYLFLHRILKPKGLLKKDLLTPAEEENATYLVNLYGFDNLMMRASTVYALMECAKAGIADQSSLSHIGTFFDDLEKMERGERG